MRVDSPAALWGIFFLSLLFAVSFCSADDKTLIQVVGSADCADCKDYNVKTIHAFSGLRVSIDCKLENGEMKRVGDGELDKEGKFKVSVPQEMIKEDCYAQLHSTAAVPCTSHDELEATKIVLKSKNNGIQTFGPNKNLKFSTALCTSKTFWPPYFKYPPLPPLKHSYHSWPPLPPLTHPYHSWPPLPPLSHPWKKSYHSWPPLPPLHKHYPLPPLHKHYPLPPLHKHKPLPPPVPVSTPVPVYKPLPPPVPIYKPKPPVYKPKPPVYKPKPPVYKPKPPVPVYKPPVPVYKPPVPIYKPPVPIYKPPVPIYKPPVPIYKPPVPIYKPPVYKKPCPPLPKLPPLPKFPPKYFHHHHKYGYFPPLPPHHP